MDSNKVQHVVTPNETAAVLCNLGSAQYGAIGGVSQNAYDEGSKYAQLRVQVAAAGIPLRLVWDAVLWGPALYGIGDVYRIAADLGAAQRLVQYLSGLAYKGAAPKVFVASGRLAYKDYSGLCASYARNRVGSVLA